MSHAPSCRCSFCRQYAHMPRETFDAVAADLAAQWARLGIMPVLTITMAEARAMYPDPPDAPLTWSVEWQEEPHSDAVLADVQEYVDARLDSPISTAMRNAWMSADLGDE